MTVDNFNLCSSCNEPIVSDGPNGERCPCPKCGSLNRQIFLSGTSSGKSTLTAELTVVTYPQALLTFAEGLLISEQPKIAVVVAHMAAEIAAERSFSEAFRNRGLTYLEDPITEFFPSYNLANDRVRRIFTALTGNNLEKFDFWPAFKTSSARRNKIVHEGGRCSHAEATESIKAVRELVEHLGK